MRSEAVNNRFALAGILALVAALAGGAEPLWAKASVLLAAGLLVTASPNLPRAPALFWTACLLLLFCASTLLPLGVGQGEWRDQAQSLGINLPASVSPQPLLTLEGLFSLLGAGLFCAWMVAAAPAGHARIQALRIWCILMLPLAALVLWGNFRGWVNPLAPDAQCFSLLPNRNHTALLFAMMANVGWGFLLQGVRQRLRPDIWLGASLALLGAAAVLVLPSRAALALLFLGLTLQLAIRVRNRDWGALKLTLPLLLFALAATAYHGGHILERISGSFHNSLGAGEFRLKLWGDTANMIGDNPWTGVGLGNFEQVFVHYRGASASYMAILHPESDWLWLAAEAGIPVAIITGVLVLGLMWVGLRRQGQSTVEVAAGVAVLLALLHSLVDVPLHRLGTLLPAVFLFAVWAGPAFGSIGSGYVRLLARTAGLLLVAGCGLMLLAYRVPVLNSQTALDATLRTDASAQVTAGMHWMPLDWRVHFAEGVQALEDGRIQDARYSFRRMRFLSSHSARPAYYEGLAWLPYLPREALPAWRVALERPIVHELEVFQEMVHHAYQAPDLWPGLARLSDANPSHRLYFLLKAPVNVVESEIQRELLKPVPLQDLDLNAMTELQLTWIRRGLSDSTEKTLLMDAYPDALQWRVAAHLAAARMDFQHAVDLVSSNVSVPLPPSPAPSVDTLRLQSRLLSNANDVTAGLELLHRFLHTNPQAALLVIERMKGAGLAIPHMEGWEATALSQLGHFQPAWHLWQHFLEKDHHHLRQPQ